MEGSNKKQVGSSSSLTSELFGPKDSHHSSTSGIFDSLFPPSSKVIGRDSLHAQLYGKTGSQASVIKGNDEKTQNTANKDMSTIYQAQGVLPCHLSSSIYYGGQDCVQPQSTENAGLNTLYKKDNGEDDSGSATRGNWWEGSLYY